MVIFPNLLPRRILPQNSHVGGSASYRISHRRISNKSEIGAYIFLDAQNIFELQSSMHHEHILGGDAGYFSLV